jgi:phosphohistidine swiveling domain-containing protein
MAADQASMTKSQFLERYGHLRPGTYDLLSSRYDEKPDVYFDWAAQREAPQATARFELPEQQEKQLDSALSAHGLEVGAKDMLGFIRSAIEWRELSKFYFSQNLSDALKLMGKIGDRLGIPRDLMSFADVSAFRELYVGSGDQQHALMQSINLGKVQYEQGLRLVLPPLIRDVEDVWSFEWPDAEPNFITQLEVLAPVADSVERNSISGAVVFIPSADPGYDWLFAYPIAGLVTAWGGANSHMAIRAGELGLPAVVGAGEVKFRAWSKAKKLHIDCAARRVEIIQ